MFSTRYLVYRENYTTAVELDKTQKSTEFLHEHLTHAVIRLCRRFQRLTYTDNVVGVKPPYPIKHNKTVVVGMRIRRKLIKKKKCKTLHGINLEIIHKS